MQGLPLIKPPYDRITAYDMNTGDFIWQKTHSSTPDEIRNHPALKGLDLPRLGQPGRTFIGVLATKSLLIAGEGGVHTNEAGQRVALLRAYDKATGADVGAVDMPEKQTGSPDDLHDQRPAVHRPRGQRRQWRGVDRLCPAPVTWDRAISSRLESREPPRASCRAVRYRSRFAPLFLRSSQSERRNR